MKIEKFSDLHELSAVLASNLTSEIITKVRNSEHIFLSLSGGNTPTELYQLMNKHLIDADIDVSNYLGVSQIDERWLSSRHERSNQLMIKNAIPLISNLKWYNPIPVSNTCNTIIEAVSLYESTMRELIEKFNKIDYGIFGMGKDGHTASLFPNDPILENLTNKFVTSGYIKSQKEFRITVTPSFFLLIKQKVFIITGSDKGKILKEALQTDQFHDYPILYAIDNQSLICMDQSAYDAYKS